MAALSWLQVHATHMITVNSTTTFNSLAIGKPVATLGRGWFSDNGVTTNRWTIAGALKSEEIKADPGRAERFMLHMLSREITIDDISVPAKLKEIIELFHPFLPLTLLPAHTGVTRTHGKATSTGNKVAVYTALFELGRASCRERV